MLQKKAVTKLEFFKQIALVVSCGSVSICSFCFNTSKALRRKMAVMKKKALELN